MVGFVFFPIFARFYEANHSHYDRHQVFSQEPRRGQGKHQEEIPG
jgi:hypothetical protein